MIIENPKNNSNHSQAILKIIANYKNNFGSTKLYYQLLEHKKLKR